MLTNYFRTIFKNKVDKSRYDNLNFNFYDPNSLPKSNAQKYKTNVIVYRCVNLISQSASHVPWKILKFDGNRYHQIGNHPGYHLLKRPNPTNTGADFFCDIINNLLLFGNSYIIASNNEDNKIQEMYNLPSQAVEIVFSQNHPIAYKYNSLMGEKIYSIDPISSMSRILHIKNFNPTDPNYGFSCLDAADKSIEHHFEATNWNNALLKNGARPSGALIVKDGNNYLTDEQYERLNLELHQKFTGSHNSGKPLLLEGGLDWREMSISPKDMDFIESKNSAAREIALALGVPPQLLGINGDNTYNNMQEARLALWEETLIPLLDKLGDVFSCWLSHWYNEDLIIDFDREAISALTQKRENIWSQIANADFMTINEKRHFVGLPSLKGKDIL